MKAFVKIRYDEYKSWCEGKTQTCWICDPEAYYEVLDRQSFNNKSHSRLREIDEFFGEPTNLVHWVPDRFIIF